MTINVNFPPKYFLKFQWQVSYFLQQSSIRIPTPPRIEIEEGTPTSSTKMDHDDELDEIEIELTKM